MLADIGPTSAEIGTRLVKACQVLVEPAPHEVKLGPKSVQMWQMLAQIWERPNHNGDPRTVGSSHMRSATPFRSGLRGDGNLCVFFFQATEEAI